ncbi:unnamed protein product, partial [Didymodactylos carnosus]
MTDTSQTHQPNNLDQFYLGVVSKEPSQRLECFAGLEEYLKDQNNTLECEDTYGFVSGLLKWVECSNYRIALNGLKALEAFAERLGGEFERYIDDVVLACIDRLGDSKDQVRNYASDLLTKLMTISTAQRLSASFAIDKTGRLLLSFVFGASSIQLNKLVPLICKLVTDSNGQVRQQAVDTLVEIYRHVGEKVRNDIAKRDIPEAKLKILYEKFDDVVASGRMLAKEDNSNVSFIDGES